MYCTAAAGSHLHSCVAQLRAYGKAGIGNWETEMGTKDTLVPGAMFSS